MNDGELMARTELLKSVDPGEAARFLHEGSFRMARYGKNGIVHFAGEVCCKLEIILGGKVVVERIDESGRLMTIAEFYSGDIISGNLIFSKNPHYPMTVTAKQPAVILEISKDRLLGLLSDNHEFLREYLAYVSDHTAILGDKIRHYVNRTIRESVVSYLDYESKKQNSRTVALPLTKKALAEKIGVQRTSLSRELAKMRQDGLISFSSTAVTLLEGFYAAGE